MGEIPATQSSVILQGQIAFLFVVSAAGANEIAHPIRAATGPRDDVIDVQDAIAGAVITGVSALMVEFHQHVFAEFVAGQFSVLVFDPFDVGIFHQLNVESDQFHRDPLDRVCAGESVGPGTNIFDAALERRREPSIWALSVVEARLPITGLSGAAVAPDCPAGAESFPDGVPAVIELGGEDDLAGFLIDDCEAGCFRSGIDFESEIRRLNARCFSPQNDSERREMKHGGFAPRKKHAGHRRMAGRERSFVGVKNGDFHM